jgi:hypothetical protein
MRREGRFRPIGWLVATGTLVAMVLTAIIAAPGGAAIPEKEYKASFEMECVIAPGVLNIHAKEKLKVTTAALGPEVVTQGEEVSFHAAHSTIQSPVELTESFAALGSNEVKGATTNFTLDGTGIEPASLNVARPAEYPNGLPFLAPVEKGQPGLFFIPSNAIGESTLTYEFGPEKITAASGVVKAEVDNAPGYEEVEPSVYKETGKGIITSVEGRNSGAHVIGPLKTTCNAPSGVILAEIPIPAPPTSTTPTTTTTTTTTTTACPTATSTIKPLTIEPNHGPAGGGTTVLISGAEEAVSLSFGSTAVSFERLASGQLRVVTPPGRGAVTVFATGPSKPCSFEMFFGQGQFTYETGSAEKVEYKNWKLSGSITDKKAGQAITLPAGSTFNGSGELKNTNGSVRGNVSIPPFTVALNLFGLTSVNVGLTMSQFGSLEGTATKSQSVSGDETLSASMKLNVAITSIALLGLKIPTTCATAEPLAFSLVSTLTREELLIKGWSFAGTTSVPRIKCHGGFLGGAFGKVLTTQLAGPEDPFSLSFTAPSG